MMKTPSTWILLVVATLVCAVPVSAQVLEATLKIDGMI